jgi:hypothetical protein
MFKKFKIILSFLAITSISISCVFTLSYHKDSEHNVIVPNSGYDWPSQERQYWPTSGWETASMEDHNIDPDKM